MIINHLRIISMHLFMLIACTGGLLSACSKSDEPTIKIYEYREKIGKKMKEVDVLRNQSTFGTHKGMYPDGSKSILDSAYTSLQNLLQQIKEKIYKDEKVISETEDHLQYADNQITKFKNTIRTENLVIPAELEINGKTGGYIDFGSQPAFSSFGDSGHQAFTVEFWVKLKDVEGFFYLISTFTDDAGNNHERKGWAINSYNYGGNNMRMTYGMGFNDLMEPGFHFNTTNEWVHLAIVTNEDGVDGEISDGRPIMTKMYLNGTLQLKTISNQPPEKAYSSNIHNIAMVAFGGLDISGNRIGDKGGNGSLKHFHLWKTAKTQEEIKSIMLQPTRVIGTESDLVCGWAFNLIPDDDTQIKDLTGKYTARIIGDHQWQEIQ